MALMYEAPYCRRYDWVCTMPAILASAYASLVGSSGPVSRASSGIGCGARLG